MNPPNFHTRVLGSRLVAPVVLAVSAFVTYLWWSNGCEGYLGLFTMILFAAAGQAMKQVAAYRQWAKDWASLAPPDQRQKPKAMPLVLAGAAILFVLYLAGLPSSQLHAWAKPMPGVVACVVALALLHALWRFWRRQQQAKSRLVAVAVRGPVRPVASLPEAYQRLPDYCQHLLKGRPQ